MKSVTVKERSQPWRDPMTEMKKTEKTPSETAPPPARGGLKISIRHALVVFFLAFFLGIAAGAVKSNTVMAVVKTYDELEVFADILSLIETNYVEEVEPRKLIEGAINGMLRALDPHSSYMTPEMYKEMQVETEGEFGGLGIEITIEDGWLTVVSPMEDTPAWDAGIMPGDKIIRVDGESTHDMTLMEAVRKIRGKKGTDVTLTIMREGFEEPKDFTVTRQIIHTQSVKSEFIDGKWGYARIRSFAKDTAAELAAALDEFNEKGMQGLLLDLRNNPGGLLSQAVEVADQFLDKGELIVYTRGRLPNQNMRFTAKTEQEEPYYPVVVLVNHGSASASEIVAGALQDLKRALVVGVTTFGKGSVQTIIPLKGGAGLRLTTSRYYTPSGRQIQEVGIEPDVVVEQTLPAAPQAKKIEPMREEDLLNHMRGVKPDKKKEKEAEPVAKEPPHRKVVDLEKDVQLRRALDLLKSWNVIDQIREHQRAVKD